MDDRGHRKCRAFAQRPEHPRLDGESRAPLGDEGPAVVEPNAPYVAHAAAGQRSDPRRPLADSLFDPLGQSVHRIYKWVFSISASSAAAPRSTRSITASNPSAAP